MNKKFFVYIFFFVPILCTSCDWFDDPEMQDKDDVTKMEGISPAFKQRLNEQDSLFSESTFKNDSLIADLNQYKGFVEDSQSEIKELKSPSHVWACFVLFALLLSIIAIVLSILRTNKKVDKWEVKEMAKQMIKEQVKDLEYRMNRAESNIKEIGKGSSTSKTTSANTLIDKRLVDLDIRLSRIERNSNSAQSNSHSYDNYLYDNFSSQETTPAKEPEYMRTGYAKVNSSKYFVEIFNSQQEDCVYKINFINKEEGEFDIISLGKIKTINDLKEVLDLTPDSCLLNEASRHEVVDKGQCKKIDGNTWEVTKKLVIKVFK